MNFPLLFQAICLAQLSDPDATLRQWILLCLAKLWENYDEAKTFAVKENAHEKICALLVDPVPEVNSNETSPLLTETSSPLPKLFVILPRPLHLLP